MQLFFCAIRVFLNIFFLALCTIFLNKIYTVIFFSFIKPSRCEIRFVLCYGLVREVNPHVYNSLTFVAVSHFRSFFRFIHFPPHTFWLNQKPCPSKIRCISSSWIHQFRFFIYSILLIVVSVTYVHKWGDFSRFIRKRKWCYLLLKNYVCGHPKPCLAFSALNVCGLPQRKVTPGYSSYGPKLGFFFG